MPSRKRKTKSDLLYEKLEEVHQDVKELRQKDIPDIRVKVKEVEVKSSVHAKLVSAIGGIIAIAVSAAIAMIR